MFSPLFLNIPLQNEKGSQKFQETEDSSSYLTKMILRKKRALPIVQNRKYRKQNIVNNNQQSAGTNNHAMSRISNAAS